VRVIMQDMHDMTLKTRNIYSARGSQGQRKAERVSSSVA
jgi:hypothetical protein